MKFSWSKIFNLDKDTLEKEGQEVEVEYKTPEKSKPKKRKKATQKTKESKKDFVSSSERGEVDIDLYEDDKEDKLIIKAKVPGVKAEDLDVVVEPDLIIVRGNRKFKSKKNSSRYYYRECSWGKFLRRLVLPCRVKPDEVDASLKQGILTVILPKVEESSSHVEVK